MATINKQMKTFNVPSGNDTKCYEIVDDKGRKCLAKDWATNSSSAFSAGEYVIKDGVCYKFTSAHTAGSAWSASEVTATNLGNELRDLNSAITSGTHEDLTAGNAFEVLSDRGDTDKVPYVFRKTGGEKKAYNREMLKKIVGGTVAWNQQIVAGEISTVYGSGVTYTHSNGAYTLNGTPGGSSDYTLYKDKTMIADHVYLLTGCPANGSDSTYYINFAGVKDKGNGNIFKQSGQTTRSFDMMIKNGYTASNLVFKPNLFDLTQMFGSTIADAIYAMEQATAGSGVAFFRSLFSNDYYAYDAGTLMSVQAKEHRTVGFNQWDEEWEVGSIKDTTGANDNSRSDVIRSKNYIPVFSNTSYYFVATERYIFFYDVNKTLISMTYKSGNATVTTPENCAYMRFRLYPAYGTAYKGDICINLSDASKNGTYEPYEEHVYPLDSDLVLRGIPKLDSDGNLYYDGDEYTPDGSVKRRYGIVDLGTLNWDYDSTYSRFIAELSTLKIVVIRTLPMICSKYNAYTTGGGVEDVPDKSIYNGALSNVGTIYVVDSGYTDAVTFKTAMSGVYLVYELATPTTETADPYHELQICSRYGTEEFVDAGVTASTPTRDVSIPVGTNTFYPVNVFDYIEELTQPDHDMVADANIVSGKYFMVGNSLYKATTTIPQGDTINPGTNCTAYSLAEALNLINQ